MTVFKIEIIAEFSEPTMDNWELFMILQQESVIIAGLLNIFEL